MCIEKLMKCNGIVVFRRAEFSNFIHFHGPKPRLIEINKFKLQIKTSTRTKKNFAEKPI